MSIPGTELTRDEARLIAVKVADVWRNKGNVRGAIDDLTRGLSDASMALVLDEARGLVTGLQMMRGGKPVL